MTDKVEEQKKLDKLMKDGWSYRAPSGTTFSTDILVDPTTSKQYKLHVNDGKLSMTEVSK